LDGLDSRRERDRCVGIVSHVADLRQRVPPQLEIVKSRAGSALRHHTAPAAARAGRALPAHPASRPTRPRGTRHYPLVPP
ncbi:hypothetical protein, partial [Streptomyces sp. GSL17-113]|uniref:hypothetical protein n=1 Tax=Streptomyces sp. GSL17-113 TaxID=3115365 RepID=UPI002E799FA6